MRPTSIFTQIFALSFALLLVCSSAVAAILVIAPPPEPSRMSVDEMSWALSGKRSWVIDTRRSATPPTGIRSQLVEEAIARQLSMRPDQFRATWIRAPDGIAGRGQSLVVIDGRETIIESDRRGFTLRSGPGARLATNTLVPLVISARRNTDGSWTWAVPRDPQMIEWRMRWIVGLAGGTLILALLAWLAARRIARPIEDLGREANRADLNTGLSVVDRGPREVRETATALVQMHGRMASAAEERVRLLAAVAHDLRTPLTAIRLRVEALWGANKGRVVEDIDRMAAMIDETLSYAEAQTIRPKLDWVALDDVLKDRVARGRELGEAISLDRADKVTIWSDRLMIQRMVDNLIENGLRFANEVQLTVKRRGSDAIVIVGDDGPGIPETKLSQILDPFARLEVSRNRKHGGIGLGLSIVNTFSATLGATLSLSNRPSGFTASLTFPASDARPLQSTIAAELRSPRRRGTSN